MILRRPLLPDVFVDGDQCAVFVGDKVVVLSELATSILLSVPEGSAQTLDAVTGVVLEAFGPPAPPLDATDLVAEQAAALAELGILLLETHPAPATGHSEEG